MPTTTEQKLAQLREKFLNLTPDDKRLFSTHYQLERDIAALRTSIIIYAASRDGARGPTCPKIFDPLVDGPAPHALAINSPLLDQYSRLLSLRHVFETSPEFARAVQSVRPLYEELVELEKLHEAETLAEQEKQTELSNAVKRAREKALAAIERDPAVVKAREALTASK